MVIRLSVSGRNKLLMEFLLGFVWNLVVYSDPTHLSWGPPPSISEWPLFIL